MGCRKFAGRNFAAPRHRGGRSLSGVIIQNGIDSKERFAGAVNCYREFLIAHTRDVTTRSETLGSSMCANAATSIRFWVVVQVEMRSQAIRCDHCDVSQKSTLARRRQDPPPSRSSDPVDLPKRSGSTEVIAEVPVCTKDLGIALVHENGLNVERDHCELPDQTSARDRQPPTCGATGNHRNWHWLSMSPRTGKQLSPSIPTKRTALVDVDEFPSAQFSQAFDATVSPESSPREDIAANSSTARGFSEI